MNNPQDTGKDISYSWLPLDNAAKIYPAVTSKEHTAVFRISAVFNTRINYNRLIGAIAMVEERFPYFKAYLKKGFFWYYLENSNRTISPEPDNDGLCRSFKKNELLIRILAIENRISVEFSHVLTDGTGGEQFLTSLLIAYFSELVVRDGIPDQMMGTPMSDEEYEDAYNRYFKSDIPPVIKYSKAFHLPFSLNRKPRFNTLTMQISLEHVKAFTAEKDISVTDYLVSVYLFVLQDIYAELPRYLKRKVSKILRIQVPVNLRRIYSSKTMRNFSLFVLPEIDLRLGQYTFDEISKIVHYKMKLETDRKLINKIISRNVGSEKNPIVRGIPLFIKNFILRYKYYSQGANQYSGVITNLGKIELPPVITDKIKHFVFIAPPPNAKLIVNCGIIGYNGMLTISFGSITGIKKLEMKFVQILYSHKVPVKLIHY